VYSGNSNHPASVEDGERMVLRKPGKISA
jgi:hypothetical protein